MVFKVDAEGKFSVNGNPITPETGMEELKKYYKLAKQNETKAGPPIMFFEADDKAKYVSAVAALDMIRTSAPNWTIGMMTEKMAPNPAEGAAPGTPPAPEAPK
jgi:biopolymer transport protein ExbD